MQYVYTISPTARPISLLHALSLHDLSHLPGASCRSVLIWSSPRVAGFCHLLLAAVVWVWAVQLSVWTNDGCCSVSVMWSSVLWLILPFCQQLSTCLSRLPTAFLFCFSRQSAMSPRNRHMCIVSLSDKGLTGGTNNCFLFFHALLQLPVSVSHHTLQLLDSVQMIRVLLSQRLDFLYGSSQLFLLQLIQRNVHTMKMFCVCVCLV